MIGNISMNITNDTLINYLSNPTQSNYIFYIKLFYLVIITVIALLFGLLPLCFNNCRKDTRFLNYANAFSGGIFLGIGFFHLFPEANENFELYFATPEGKTSYFYGTPISYLLAFISYSLILYLEKVAFNSHALIAHTHNNEGLNDNHLNEPLLESKIYHDCADNMYKEEENEHNKSDSSEDEEIGHDEQIIKNVVNSKRQFSSLLHSRNISK